MINGCLRLYFHYIEQDVNNGSRFARDNKFLYNPS